MNKCLILILLAVCCLSVSNAAEENFDHFSTGFVLDGAHVNVSCEGCHSAATFGSTQPICATCHSPSGIVRASTKPANHVLSTEQCADCHGVVRHFGWYPWGASGHRFPGPHFQWHRDGVRVPLRCLYWGTDCAAPPQRPGPNGPRIRGQCRHR